jgi:hypothetical protein
MILSLLRLICLRDTQNSEKHAYHDGQKGGNTRDHVLERGTELPGPLQVCHLLETLHVQQKLPKPSTFGFSWRLHCIGMTSGRLGGETQQSPPVQILLGFSGQHPFPPGHEVRPLWHEQGLRT